MIVRSFISNFKTEVLHANWRRDWAVTLVLTLALVLLWEGLWRARGFKPMVVDSTALWANTRRTVKSDSVVLIGTSRMALGLDPQTFAQVTGVRPIQLAINGASPVPVLKHFAQDESFKGTIICELTEVVVTAEHNSPKTLKYIDEYESPALTNRLEFRVENFLQQHLVMTLPEVNPYTVLKSALAGKLPVPPYISLFPDRSSYADFTKADQQKLMESKRASQVEGTRAEQALFLEMAARLEEHVARIQMRGGQVIFLHMPVTGVQWMNNEITFPKRDFWDVFARHTRAGTIHFKDYPELDRFDCPDYSHLDKRDVPAFTAALAKIIQERDFRR
jgi:hypothetical protein